MLPTLQLRHHEQQTLLQGRKKIQLVLHRLGEVPYFKSTVSTSKVRQSAKYALTSYIAFLTII